MGKHEKPAEHAVGYLREAAGKLEALDGLLDRARDSAGDYHDRVAELQEDVRRATQRAISLLTEIEGGGHGEA